MAALEFVLADFEVGAEGVDGGRESLVALARARERDLELGLLLLEGVTAKAELLAGPREGLDGGFELGFLSLEIVEARLDVGLARLELGALPLDVGLFAGKDGMLLAEEAGLLLEELDGGAPGRTGGFFAVDEFVETLDLGSDGGFGELSVAEACFETFGFETDGLELGIDGASLGGAGDDAAARGPASTGDDSGRFNHFARKRHEDEAVGLVGLDRTGAVHVLDEEDVAKETLDDGGEAGVVAPDEVFEASEDAFRERMSVPGDFAVTQGEEGGAALAGFVDDAESFHGVSELADDEGLCAVTECGLDGAGVRRIHREFFAEHPVAAEPT